MKEAVVITGAAGGIGRAFSEVYAKEGKMTLVMVDRNGEALGTLKDTLTGKYACEIITHTADLLRDESTDEIVALLANNGLKCKSLVHASGLFSYQDLDKAEAQKILVIHKLHTTQPLALTLALLPQITECGNGEIIAMSSMARRLPFPGLNIYSGTKAFVSNLMQSLHNELYPKGIHALSCEPGAVDTSLYGLPEKYRRLALNLHVAITPLDLASGAVKAARKGRTIYTPGVVNKVFLPILTHLPDPVLRFIDRRISQFKK